MTGAGRGVSRAPAEPLGVVWRLAQPEQPRAPQPAVPARLDWVRPEDAAALAAAGRPGEAAERLGSGKRCCAAWSAGQLAAWGWVSFGGEQVGELGLTVTLRPEEAYIWDCVTVPAFRRRGLYAALLAHMARALQAEGVQTLWIGADYHNAASHAGMANAGFSPVADLVAAPPAPGERRRQAWLVAHGDASPELVAAAGRVYLAGRERVWLFDDESG